MDASEPRGFDVGLTGTQEVTPFLGGLSGKEEGFKMPVGKGIELSVVKEKSPGPETGKEVFAGIKGIFLGPDEKGEIHALTTTEFTLELAGMTEGDVPQVVQAIGTLVRMGAKPSEVAEFVSHIDESKRKEAHKVGLQG